MRFTIGRKLALGFGLIVSLSAVLGGLSFLQAAETQSQIKTIASLSDQIDSVGAVDQAQLAARLAVNRFIISPSPERAGAIDAAGKNFATGLSAASSKITTTDAKAVLDQLGTTFTDYSSASRELVTLVSRRTELFAARLGPTGSKLDADLSSLAESAAERGEHDLASAALAIRGDINAVGVAVARFLFTNNPDEFKTADRTIPIVTDRLRSLKTLAKTSNEARVDELSRTFQDYAAIAADVRILQDQISILRQERLDAVGPKLTALGQQLAQNLAERAGRTKIETTNNAQASAWKAKALTAVVLIIGIVSAIVITRGIVSATRALVNRLKDIAEGEGDLTQRADESRADELGEVGKWFNAFIAKVQIIVRDLDGATREVASAATQIAASSEEMSAAAGEVARQASGVSQAAVESQKIAEDGGVTVHSTIEGIKKIDQSVSSSAKSVSELGARSDEIGQIILVINDIADQTNLLALNAAIEAARAGEHGRGFAVVADEVRKLAERTTKATEQVSASIRTIQQETVSSVQRMNEGTTHVREGVESAARAGESLDQIVTKTKTVASMMQSIAAAAEEAGAGSSQAASAAGQLSTKAEQLQAMVKQFKF